MNQRSFQPFGYEAVVARFPAQLKAGVLFVVEALQECGLRVEVRDAAGERVFSSPPRRLILRTMGRGETLQAEYSAIMRIPIAFEAPMPARYAVVVSIDGTEAATINLVVRTAVS